MNSESTSYPDTAVSLQAKKALRRNLVVARERGYTFSQKTRTNVLKALGVLTPEQEEVFTRK